MRSRSSSISTTSSCLTTESVKTNSNDPMAAIEKEVVSEFVLKLYHEGLIPQDGLIEKRRVSTKFSAFDKAQEHKEYFAGKNIGTLLWKTRLLNNTERGSPFYAIRMKNLFEYRNAKLKIFDDLHMSGKSIGPNTMSSDGSGHNDGVIEETIEIAPDAEEFPVVFKGGFEQIVDPDFSATISGCYICQKNFTMQIDFEDHVEFHGIESDFEFLSSPGKSCNNIFEMVYRLVNKSHNFYFTMKTSVRDIILEKIILIKPNMMHYIKTNALPYEIPSDGIDSFLIDSHMFTIGAEQPIVLVYRNKSDKTRRFVEQHHFLRTEYFPQVHFNVRSFRIPSTSIMKAKFKLGEYENEVREMKKIIKGQNLSTEALSSLSLSFGDFIKTKKMDQINFHNIFRTLNQIEDVCAQEGYSHLRQEGVQIKRFGQEYSLKLNKLPKDVTLENILSPLDEIYLSTPPEENNPVIQQNKHQPRRTKPKVYRAVVERIYYNTVCFQYKGQPICDKGTYNVTFKPSRLGLRYQYRALDTLRTMTTIKNYLFPTSLNSQSVASTRDFQLFNPSIKTNVEQLQAVQNIVDGPNSFAPYIIFGPPGTGKTSTIVEAVLQLWQKRPDTRILITAGSNAACDEVAVRLCRVLTDLSPGDPNVLRIFARSNDKRLESIDELLIECSNFYRFHFYPSVEVIREFRIIACTLSVVGKLVTGGIGNDFFTHVFIDECAASTEPESLIGIAGTFSEKTRLILAGDHKQLGPVLKSSVANDLGLKVSLMERLLNLDCYSVNSNGDYDRSIQSRLVKNFRSHSKIVDLFNTLYYGGSLQPMANDDDVNLGSKWCRMPNKGFPIVFHAVYGTNRQERRSLSLSNEREVEVVMDYVKDLIYFGINGQKVCETDIGIISPYKKQYMRIQEELNRRRWYQIEVGAVETFQGKEKRIIIVSTVRSFTKTLGFLDNPRRLNVILSRAQCLLIMIGNPNTLSLNEDFKYIITECRRNNSAIGSFRDIERQERGETPVENEKSTKSNINSANSATKKPNVQKRRNWTRNKNKAKSVVLNNKSSPANRIENNLREVNGNSVDISTAVHNLQNTISWLSLTDKQYDVKPINQNCRIEKLTQEDIKKNVDFHIGDLKRWPGNLQTEIEPVKTNMQRQMAADKDLIEIQKRINQLCQPTKVEPPKVNVTNYSVHNATATKRQFASPPSYSHTTPYSTDSSDFTYNNVTNISERDRGYEKILPISKAKPAKGSKCVLC